MLKKIIVLSTLIGCILFAAVLLLTGVEQIKSSLMSFYFPNFLMILFIFLIEFIVLIYRWKIILKASGHNIAFKKLIAPKTACYATSYLTLFSRLGGEPVRAYMLKKKTGVSFITGLATTISDKILEFTSSLMFVLCGLLFLLMKYTISNNIELMLIAIVSLFILLIVLFYTRVMKRKEIFILFVRIFGIDKLKYFAKIGPHIENLEDEISDLFINHKKIVLTAIILSTIANILILSEYILLAHFLGYSISILGATLIFSLTALATAFPIPGALGPYEGLSALAFSLLGIAASSGVAFSLIIRGTELLMVGIGLLFMYHLGIKLALSFLSEK